MQDPETREPANPLLAVGLCAVAVVLSLLPVSLSEAIRAVVRDASMPGAVAVATCTATFDTLHDHLFDRRDLESRIATLEIDLADERRHSRQLALVATRAKDVPADATAPLVMPDLLPARILGTEAAEAWRAGRLVDVGLDDAVREEAAVLAEEGPLVDRGRDAGLDVGQSVLDGRTLVGRIRTVGRWTSVVQPLTDPEFRMQVRIARRTPRGLVLGPTGILRGTGDATCRLDFVGSTEAVDVDDEVYTATAANDEEGTDGAAIATDLGVLLVGRITSAELPTGAPHWDLAVTPAAPKSSDRVSVLLRRFNPERLAAHE